MTHTKQKILALALATGIALTGCTQQDQDTPKPPPTTSTPTKTAPPATITTSVDNAQDLTTTTPVEVTTDGTLKSVEVTTDGTPVPGTLNGMTWTPQAPLADGATYTVVATATNEDDTANQHTTTFTTMKITKEIKADLTPFKADTPVGVGMPVILKLNAPVPKDLRASFVERLTVTPSVAVEGSWRWMNDKELHYRPKDYWPANTTVRVQVGMNGFTTAPGVSGTTDRDITFRVGNSNVSTVDCDTHQMTTTINGQVAKTMPISCGMENSKRTYITRSGVHLVLSKSADYVMRGDTAGAGSYVTPVKWATRISNSGEFVHGAPWSVGSQGKRNVSHGCINASDANAKWFYEISQVGDPVNVVGTDRPMEIDNGWGDWTVPYEQWAN